MQFWGGLKAYRQNIEDRVGATGYDRRALNVLKNTASTQGEIAAALRNSSPEFQKQATLVNNNIAALEAYNESVMNSAHPLSALASNLVGVGKAFVSMSIQFGIVWLLSAGIAALVNKIDSSINAMKYAKEAAENLNKAYEDMNTTQKQNTKTVEEYGKTWEKLKDGVDKNTGKNISLSDDEYNQYKESINQIISILPGIASGWDDNNNAILLNVQSMDELNQKMEEYAQKQREALLAGDETKAFADKASKVDLAADAKTKQEALDLLQTIQRRDIASLQEYANNHPDLSGELEPYVTMAQDYLESAPQAPQNQAIADNRSIEQRICIKPVKRSRQRDLSLLVRFMQRRATPITQKDVSRR